MIVDRNKEDFDSTMEIRAFGIFADNELLKKASVALEQQNKKIGRNEFCPCGSGKKYKKCCGK